MTKMRFNPRIHINFRSKPLNQMYLTQIGWLMVRKHPDVKEKGSKIDLSDLRSDPVVMFQHRHYLPLALTLCIVVPTLIPVRIHQS